MTRRAVALAAVVVLVGAAFVSDPTPTRRRAYAVLMHLSRRLAHLFGAVGIAAERAAADLEPTRKA